MKNAKFSRLGGFTLIELLVVVLIIGILASVALPQYQTAVAKSRLGAVMPVVKTMHDALDVYYLANGAYPPDAVNVALDVDFPSGCGETATTYRRCTNGDVYDLLDPGLLATFGGNTKAKVGYVMWLEHSAHPGLKQCVAVTSDKAANSVCKSMGGTVASGFSISSSTLLGGGATTVYNLP